MNADIYIWYWISTLILAALLFRPVRKFIFVTRVRKIERQLKRQSTEQERETIRKKIIPLTAVIVVTFSMLFNFVLIGKAFLGK